MTVNVRNLKQGDYVSVKFHGSAVYGNQAYEEKLYFTEHVSETEVTFSETPDFREPITIFFHDNRWRYGTSSEVFTVVERL